MGTPLADVTPSFSIDFKAAVILGVQMSVIAPARAAHSQPSCVAALDVGRRSEIDAAYQEGSEFLQSIGVESKGEVARILDIAMNPNSLFLTLRDKKRAVNVHVSAQHALRLSWQLCACLLVWVPLWLFITFPHQRHRWSSAYL